MDIKNNTTVHDVGQHAKGTLNDFQKFILRGNVMDLAIGIVIGAAFTAVVNAFVADLVTPLIGVFGKFDFSAYVLTVNKSTFHIGAFINAVISFLLVSLVVFLFVVKPVNVLMALHKTKKPEAPTTRECSYCLSSVPIKATKCAYCTSVLSPAEAQAVAS